MRLYALILWGATSLVGLGGQSSLALPVLLDQEHNPSIFEPFASFATNEIGAQTFQVDITGRLVRLDVRLTLPMPPTDFFILPVDDAGVPILPTDAPPLLATTPDLVGFNTNGLTTVDLSSFDIQVQSGDTLAFGFANTLVSQGIAASLPGLGQVDYLSGSGFFSADGQPFQPFLVNGEPIDLLFRSFIEVPEPSSLALIAMAGTGLGLMLRKRWSRE